MVPDDLAPGDAKSLRLDGRGFALHRIRDVRSDTFRTAFGMLWNEFGAQGELESVEVLADRFTWTGCEKRPGLHLLYELLMVTHDDRPVAVRDHTAIVRADGGHAVVHMSHNLVVPEWRRSGIAGWMRALPVATARQCLVAAQCPETVPIDLVAEMEPADPEDDARTTRLTAYDKAGYLKIDPSRVRYVQPDFRSADEIDASGGARPLPLCLLVRRVGREEERVILGREVRDIVEALYGMYGESFRARDMQCVYDTLDAYPAPSEPVDLISPTEVRMAP